MKKDVMTADSVAGVRCQEVTEQGAML